MNGIELGLVIRTLALGLVIGAWAGYRFCERKVAKLEKEVKKLTQELWERGTTRQTLEKGREALG